MKCGHTNTAAHCMKCVDLCARCKARPQYDGATNLCRECDPNSDYAIWLRQTHQRAAQAKAEQLKAEKPRMWIVSRCANVECSNRADGGQMAVVHFPVSVCGNRTITLVLCSPCARALKPEGPC